jgi:hypothetical protein
MPSGQYVIAKHCKMCSRKTPEQGAKTVKTRLLRGVLGTFRRPFQLQKASFYVAKGHVLHCKKRLTATRKAVFDSSEHSLQPYRFLLHLFPLTFHI